MEAEIILEKKDKKQGLITSISTLIAIFLFLYLKTVEMADPAPVDIPVTAETTIEELELKELVVEPAGGGGSEGGQPSDAPISEPKLQTQKVLTQTKKANDTQIKSGESKNITTGDTKNTSSSTDESDDWFTSGGNNGKTGANKTNKIGKSIGNSNGDGNAEGDGTKDGPMVRLTNVNVDNIYSERDETISLKLTVNAEGIITSITKLPKTTTTNQILINQVIDAVRKQVKFSKGSKVETHYYTVKINGKG
jgi:hypothetical protein